METSEARPHRFSSFPVVDVVIGRGSTRGMVQAALVPGTMFGWFPAQ